MAYLSLKAHRFIPIYSHLSEMGINGNDFACKPHHFALNLWQTTSQTQETKYMEKMKVMLPQRKVTGRICIKTDLIPTATLRKAYLRRKTCYHNRNKIQIRSPFEGWAPKRHRNETHSALL